MHSIPIFTSTISLALILMVSLDAPVVSFGNGFVSSIKDTYDLLYNKGIEAYASQRWFECLTHLNGALTDYRVYRSTLVTCKRECRKKSSTDDGALSTKARLSEMQIFFRILKRSNCIRKCKQTHFGNRPDVLASKSIEIEFESRKPYDFLQYCHYKLDNVKEAVAASYTYLMGNPKHEPTLKNLLFYQRSPGILEEHFIDMERKIYQSLYIKAQDYQMSEDWQGVLDAIEPAIHDFIKEVDSCELLCEGKYDHEAFPEFINAVADHYVNVLKCQSTCEDKVSNLHGEKVEGFLPEMYNYLQFASYQLNNLDGAIKAVASYILFKPEDVNMQENKRIYIERGAKPDDIVPRPEAMDYYLRVKQRKSMLKFIKENYVLPFEEENENSDDVSDPPPSEKDPNVIEPSLNTSHPLNLTSINSDSKSTILSDGSFSKSSSSNDSSVDKIAPSDSTSAPDSSSDSPSAPDSSSSDSPLAPDSSSDIPSPPNPSSSDGPSASDPSSSDGPSASDPLSSDDPLVPDSSPFVGSSVPKPSLPDDSLISKYSPSHDSSCVKSSPSDESCAKISSAKSSPTDDQSKIKSSQSSDSKIDTSTNAKSTRSPASDSQTIKAKNTDSANSKSGSTKAKSAEPKSSKTKSNSKSAKSVKPNQNSKTITKNAVKSENAKSVPKKDNVVAADIPKSSQPGKSQTNPALTLSE